MYISDNHVTEYVTLLLQANSLCEVSSRPCQYKCKHWIHFIYMPERFDYGLAACNVVDRFV